MKVCWILADSFIDPVVTPEQLKEVGSTWGSWRTWRAWNTDNVLCHDSAKAAELIQRNFQANCNFYTQHKHYASIGRPQGVQLYNGEFPGEFDRPEEIVSMHLVAENYDLVLLLGYNLTEIVEDDKFQKHKKINYLNAFRATLNTYPNVQWVLIDHPGILDKSLDKITNLTCDKFEAVLQLFN